MFVGILTNKRRQLYNSGLWYQNEFGSLPGYNWLKQVIKFEEANFQFDLKIYFVDKQHHFLTLNSIFNCHSMHI